MNIDTQPLHDLLSRLNGLYRSALGTAYCPSSEAHRSTLKRISVTNVSLDAYLTAMAASEVTASTLSQDHDALRLVDAASENLISQLDHSGSLDSERTQRAAYELRLAVVQALGDPDREAAARKTLMEFDAEHDDGDAVRTAERRQGSGA